MFHNRKLKKDKGKGLRVKKKIIRIDDKQIEKVDFIVGFENV